MRIFHLLGCLLLLFPSCGLWENRHPEAWMGEVMESAPPMRDLLTQVEWAFLQAGFPPGYADTGSMKVISGWDVVSHPFSGKGIRSQATARLTDGEVKDSVLVEVRVNVQANAEVIRPLEPKQAKWENTRDDGQRAKVVLMHIKARLSGTGKTGRERNPWRNPQESQDG